LTFCGIRLYFWLGVSTSPVEFLRRKGEKNTDEDERPGRERKFFCLQKKFWGSLFTLDG
jgi:hypothetical protein